MVTLTIFLIITIVIVIIGILYLIGFWSSKIAGQVEIILFTIANLEPRKRRRLMIPEKFALPIKKIILSLVNRRRKHAAQKEAKRKLQKRQKENYKKTVP